MNKLMIFENKRVEVLEFNGNILFNPKHVAECLDIKNINDAIANFNEKQKIKLRNLDIANTDIRKLNNAGENFLTESGVYKLIFKSRKEEAERFQDWVTDEVLPSIRQTGVYEVKGLSKELQAIFAIDKKQQQIEQNVKAVKDDLEDFKGNAPLFNIECDTLQKSLRGKVIKELGGKKSLAYKDKSIRTKMYIDAQNQLKREFDVSSYKAIKRCQLDDALKAIEAYKPPTAYKELIDAVNRQMLLEEVIL